VISSTVVEPLPFPIGKSPFRCKGVNYRNFMAYLDVNFKGGAEGFVAGLRDPQMREFLSQPFLAASWYDALPMVPLAHDAGRELHVTSAQFARDLARFGVKRDAVGIYKVMLKFTTPETLLERSTITAKQYFDFVKSEYEKTGPQAARLRHTGVPALAASVYMNITEGFVETGLGMAGAKDVRQRWEKPASAGTAHGVPIVQLCRDISWR
jgi:hypothetical protein